MKIQGHQRTWYLIARKKLPWPVMTFDHDEIWCGSSLKYVLSFLFYNIWTYLVHNSSYLLDSLGADIDKGFFEGEWECFFGLLFFHGLLRLCFSFLSNLIGWWRICPHQDIQVGWREHCTEAALSFKAEQSSFVLNSLSFLSIEARQAIWFLGALQDSRDCLLQLAGCCCWACGLPCIVV